jgi:hypothetical protein
MGILYEAEERIDVAEERVDVLLYIWRRRLD